MAENRFPGPRLVVAACRAEEKLRAARVTLGTAAVHLVRINSGRGDASSQLGYESAWRPGLLPGTLPNGGAGEPASRPSVPAAVGPQPFPARTSRLLTE